MSDSLHPTPTLPISSPHTLFPALESALSHIVRAIYQIEIRGVGDTERIKRAIGHLKMARGFLAMVQERLEAMLAERAC